jgi:3-phenylpropionate/cinnamic acid dioxygenase small subunit
MSISNPQGTIAARGFIACLALFGLTLAFTPESPLQADNLTIEQRLERVEAEKEIRDMLTLYGQYLDTKNFEAYSKLFAREGTWSGGTTNFVPVKGPEAIRATMEKAFAERVYDPGHITNVHLVTNIHIEVDGDRATGYSKYTVMTRNDDNFAYARVMGHYDDTYIREDGRWKFLSRVASRDIPEAAQ